MTNKKMVKGYVSALVERLSHADANVRDGSSEALGVLMKVLGEPTITKLMPDVDAIKVAKVKEFMEKAELTGKLPKAEKPAAPPGLAASSIFLFSFCENSLICPPGKSMSFHKKKTEKKLS